MGKLIRVATITVVRGRTCRGNKAFIPGSAEMLYASQALSAARHDHDEMVSAQDRIDFVSNWSSNTGVRP
jgi:hypothetical protein